MKNLFSILCPKCHTELIETGYSRHETLVEHVSNPNGTPSLKPEYRCPKKCSPKRVFWDRYGDVYIGNSLYQKICHFFNYYGYKQLSLENLTCKCNKCKH